MQVRGLRLEPADGGLGVKAWSILSLCLLAASATQHLSAESKLVGTWQLQTMTIESIRACTVGGPLIDTETRSSDESRTIEVAGDAVIAHRLDAEVRQIGVGVLQEDLQAFLCVE